MSRSSEFSGYNSLTDRQTDYFTSAHARGVINYGCVGGRVLLILHRVPETYRNIYPFTETPLISK